MRTRAIEKLEKTIEKLASQLQLEQSKLKTKEAQLKHLARENQSLSEKLEQSKNHNISLRKELKKNSIPHLFFTAIHRPSQIQ